MKRRPHSQPVANSPPNCVGGGLCEKEKEERKGEEKEVRKGKLEEERRDGGMEELGRWIDG